MKDGVLSAHSCDTLVSKLIFCDDISSIVVNFQVWPFGTTLGGGQQCGVAFVQDIHVCAPAGTMIFSVGMQSVTSYFTTRGNVKHHYNC